MGFEGQIFTWKRGNDKDNFRGARLDRALCDMEWRDRFKGATVKHIVMISSDHAPLLITTDEETTRQRKKFFKFQAQWLSHEDFEDVIKKHWMKNVPVIDNVKKVVDALTQWNKVVFGNIHHRKKILLARIEGIQKSIMNKPANGLLKLEKRLRKCWKFIY